MKWRLREEYKRPNKHELVLQKGKQDGQTLSQTKQKRTPKLIKLEMKKMGYNRSH
jgi:hypothetical protein